MSEQELGKGVVYAFDVSPEGEGTPVPAGTIAPTPAPGAAYRWIHLDLAEPKVRAWIRENVDATVAVTLTLQDTRPRCVKHDGGLLLNLRGVNLNPDADPEDMVSIRLWVARGLIVSVRLRRLKAVVALREAIEAGTGPRDVGGFVIRLADGLIERMEPVVAAMADRVDDLEETSIEETKGLRAALADIRRTAIMLKRYLSPQREALSRLGIDGADYLNEDQQISLREAVDREMRIVEELDSIRERSVILNEQLMDQRAEEMNQHMLVLSVAAAVFLPLGFLTGLLGVNIGGISGANSPAAFAIFCVMLVALAGGLLWWFRKNDWI